jgi:hypothetical protein
MDVTPPRPDERFVAVDGLEKTEVPDGFVIFRAATEKVHYLNPTAAIVFELCDGTKTLGEIAEFLRQAYKLPESPLAEVITCTQSLVEQGLLNPCPP